MFVNCLNPKTNTSEDIGVGFKVRFCGDIVFQWKMVICIVFSLDMASRS